MEAGISSLSFRLYFVAFFSFLAFGWNLLNVELCHVIDMFWTDWVYSLRRSSKNYLGTIVHFSAFELCWTT